MGLRGVIDTDIGSDVDDALALATILGSDADLLGVVTAYGDTALRARIVGRLARLAGRDVRVVPGAGEPLSGAPVWWAGHEGRLYDDLDAEPVEQDDDAAAFLARTVAAYPGEVDVLCFAPLTNIATVITRYPDFVHQVRSLVMMGGRWSGDGRPEHNLASDDRAAAIVYGSGVPIVVAGLDITLQVTLDGADVNRIADGGALGGQLAREVRQWLAHWDDSLNTPHDAVVATAWLEPDLFRYSAPGRVAVTVGGLDAGQVRFTPDPDGSVRVITGVDAPAVARRIVDRIVAAGTETGPGRGDQER